MNSNGDWGEAQVSPKADVIYEEFLTYAPLELTPALQEFLESKGLEFADMQRLGARQTYTKEGTLALVYHFPEGIKFRPINDEPRWTRKGTDWNLAKKLRSSAEAAETAIVVEGETDGALMSRVLPSSDVFILPAGARYISEAIYAQLKPYKNVLVATDNDEAGNAGAEKLLSGLPNSARILPPAGKDWCESAVTGALVGWRPDPKRLQIVYSFEEIRDTDFGSFDANNWFTEPILPVGGQLIIHAPKKSLKSVIIMDLVRALATGTTFAESYTFAREGGPGKVLLVQMEIPPMFFQLRLLSWLKTMPPAEAELFIKNAYTYGIGNNRLPRLKVTDKNFKPSIYRAIEDAGAEVIAFDPIQRITGEGNLDKSNEMDLLLDFFAELQNAGVTVIACHHNNKASGSNSRDPNAMVGTQRFSGDADSICSVWHDKSIMVADDNADGRKQRNFTWTLRNGTARGGSVETIPDKDNDHLIHVEFSPNLITLESGAPEEEGPPIV